MGNNNNDEARNQLDAEMAELGIKPHTDTKPNKTEAKEEKPEQKPDQWEQKKPEAGDRTDRTPKGDEGDKDDKGEGDDKVNRDRPKKYVPIDQYTSEKNGWKTEKETLLKEIETIKQGKGSQEQKEEDIEDEVKQFAAEAGIEDPTLIKKLITLAGKAASTEVAELKKTLNTLLEDKKNSEEAKKVDDQAKKVQGEQEYFDKEWNDFLPALKSKFGVELSDEQVAEAKQVMDEISHSKEYAKYPLDYVFYKNEKDFEDAIGVKKFKGPGQGRTQGIQPKKGGDDERPTLSENPTPEEIHEYEVYMARITRGGNLASKPNEALN